MAVYRDKTKSGFNFTFNPDAERLTNNEQKALVKKFLNFQASVLQPFQGTDEWEEVYPQLHAIMAKLVPYYGSGKLQLDLAELKRVAGINGKEVRKENINRIISVLVEVNSKVNERLKVDDSLYTKTADSSKDGLTF